MIITNPSQFDQAITHFDAFNALDPNLEEVAGTNQPKELVYAHRMTEMLKRYSPDASEALLLAARCQHIGRWKTPRSDYPMTKPGYHQWRNALKAFHADTARNILSELAYDTATIDHVCALVKKELPRTNSEAQTLEDVIVLVFLEHYLAQFVATHSDYEEAKFIDILVKSLRKTSSQAHQFILSMTTLPDALAPLVKKLVTEHFSPALK